MGIQILTISAALLFLLFGVTVINTDVTMQKKQEVKALLELANHDATFAINQTLKTEGIIDLVEDEAIGRFAKRMKQNGKYELQGEQFIPSAQSVTTEPIAFLHYYVDFEHWQKDTYMVVSQEGKQLKLKQVTQGIQLNPAGGYLYISLQEENGQMVSLSPKRMVGPSLIAVAYIQDHPLAVFLPTHHFPVVSVEELKW
ncbi:hypothetical protein ACQCN2_21085 [Brevibacillus ginsengisoli]|uniref:hypothetical protein n=1 Tax=Brevibacillus ginsengisoli TaxID=363854 RepID=UPI003CFBAEC7